MLRLFTVCSTFALNTHHIYLQLFTFFFFYTSQRQNDLLVFKNLLFFFFTKFFFLFSINRTEYFNILQEWFYVLIWRCVNLKPHFTNVNVTAPLSRRSGSTMKVGKGKKKKKTAWCHFTEKFVTVGANLLTSQHPIKVLPWLGETLK